MKVSASHWIAGVAAVCMALVAVPLLGPSQEPGRVERPTDTDPAPAPPGVIRVGSISSSIAEEMATFQPFADHLASRLHAEGIGRGEVVVAQSMEEMAELLLDARVDIYVDSPFPSLRVAQLSGARPMLRRWKKGRREYHSVVFARKDTLDEVDDLRGRVIAFEDEYSTSGYLLPKACLLDNGLPLVAAGPRGGSRSVDGLTYTFSHDEEASVMWVLERKVDAAALSHASFEELAGPRLGELLIIQQTPVVPRHLVSVRWDLPRHLASAVEGALLALEDDAPGRAALLRFEGTARFDRFPGGEDSYLAPVRELMASVEKDLGR